MLEQMRRQIQSPQFPAVLIDPASSESAAMWTSKSRTRIFRPEQVLGAAVLVVLTYSCTRLILEASTCRCRGAGHGDDRLEISGEQLRWPERGYGANLDLKIYVYEVDEVKGLRELVSGRDHSIASSDCAKGQWGTQVKIHKLLMESRFRTLKKNEADFFFVPAYVKCVRISPKGLTEQQVNEHFIKVLKQLPHFHRSGGRDHIFVFPSGAGAHLLKDWDILLNRSIFLTPEGDRTDKKGFSAFNTWKDIIIPGFVDTRLFTSIAPLALSKRQYVANYLGRAQGKKGRLQLIQLAKEFPNELEAPELAFQGPAKLERNDYYKHLRNAKFCLAPRGESSWTLRFYEAFFVECVPVLLSDEVELPFQNVLDYSEFSIKWPSSRINEELLIYLRSIPEHVIEKMVARGRAVRCLFTYAPESEGCTAMSGILWELQRKVRAFHQYHHTFWLHNSSLVNHNLVPFQDWTAPFPVP